MTSLMSIFDPCTDMLPHLGWVTTFMVLTLVKFSYWYSPSSSLSFFKSLNSTLLSLFKDQQLIFVTLFFFIMNMNLAGLLPLVFSPTSHLTFNLSLSLTLWLGVMFWYSSNNLEQLLVHLTPIGCPLVLAPALVVIELVSSLIRPLTLALRLMANVMAGHMILTLISKGVFSMSLLVGGPMYMILVGFMLFELGVALIQSYVFSSLMALYWEESGSTH